MTACPSQTSVKITLRRKSCGTSTLTCRFSTVIICFSLAQGGFANVKPLVLTRAVGQPNLTFKSPWITSSRPVLSLAARMMGPRTQFQSNSASTTAMSKISDRKIPPNHFKKRGGFMNKWPETQRCLLFTCRATTGLFAAEHVDTSD